MSKRKSDTADVQQEAQAAGEMLETPPTPQQELVKLRLKQNACVGLEGTLTMGGTIMEFPESEALRLLKTTDLWVRVS